MTPDARLRVSVVVVSRDRPTLLRRCLTGLAQLRHHPVEVVVVADAAGQAAVADLAGIKRVENAAPNISAARNAGVAAAGGEVVAFLDDDAVPEPVWLGRLIAALDAPSADGAPGAGLPLLVPARRGTPMPGGAADGDGPRPDAGARMPASGGEDRRAEDRSAPSRGGVPHGASGAATGTVLGRNGISVQWGPEWVDAAAETRPAPFPGAVPRLHGTNFAVRRDLLAAVGGFDPAYAFFLDETDLCLRLARRGVVAAHVADAVVHHGFAASPRRRADRVPRDLAQLGRSLAYFLGRHAPDRAAARLAAFRREQRRRLDRHVLAGRLEARAAARLLQGLEAGIDEGAVLPPSPLAPLPPPPDFVPWRAEPAGPGLFLAGRPRDRPALERRAAAHVAAGGSATVLILGRGLRRHWMAFGGDGIWRQTGGQRGRADRGRSALAWHDPAARIAAEQARIAAMRGPLLTAAPQGPAG